LEYEVGNATERHPCNILFQTELTEERF